MSNTKTAKLHELADAVYELLQVCENGSFRDIRIRTAGDNMDDRKIRVIVNLLTTHFTVIDPHVEQKPNQLPAGTIVFLTDSIVNISVDDASVQIMVDWDTSTAKLQTFSAKNITGVMRANWLTFNASDIKGSGVNLVNLPDEMVDVFELSSVFELALQAVFNITARKAAVTHNAHPAQGPRCIFVTDGPNTVSEKLAERLVIRCDTKINFKYLTAGSAYPIPNPGGTILVEIRVNQKEDQQLVSVRMEDKLPMQPSVTVLDVTYSAGDGFAAIFSSPPSQLDSDNSEGHDSEKVDHPSAPKTETKISPETKLKNQETVDKVLKCLQGLARSSGSPLTQSMKIALRYDESDEVAKELVDGYMVKMFDTAQWQHKKFPLTITPSDLANVGHVHVLKMHADSEGEISVYILHLDPLTGYRAFELLCVFGDVTELTQYNDDEIELAQLRTECMLKDVVLNVVTPPMQPAWSISGVQPMMASHELVSTISADDWVQLCNRASNLGSSLVMSAGFGHAPLNMTGIRMSAKIVVPDTNQVRRVMFNISTESQPLAPQWGSQQDRAAQAFVPNRF